MIPLLSIIAFLLFCLVVILLFFLFSNEGALIKFKITLDNFVATSKIHGAFFMMATIGLFLFGLWGAYLAVETAKPGVLGTFIVLSVVGIVAIIGLYRFIVRFIFERTLIIIKPAVTGKVFGAFFMMAVIVFLLFFLWVGYFMGGYETHSLKESEILGGAIFWSVVGTVAIVKLCKFIKRITIK